ncbi:class I SAM-dependent methyltransferase [Paenibacillus sp. NEAU-GSW1]|uniref:class I SAM-dependent methyltransferase n=1 Tax=Paenibacillus sp. NEAU-GSW1 TaxID=2682486 RepID=UPI0012E1A837|nr:class I SAM-dependent methyltransferase [Paenibacillus sp. NEAU-GSW1]MUT67912.1 methyltransferase domain-containing protein [Paenibacillus sp. NEAU-GSW1]
MSKDSKERFSDRADLYAKYRPSYPPAAIDCLFEEAGARPGAIVADIGSGTGIFSKLMLERGCEVIALEPNQEMRLTAERELAEMPGYRSAAGAAEETGLSAESVDLIVCAQSFHWFDRPAAQQEFRRILKPSGKAALIWNSRKTGGTPFLEGYEQLLRHYAADYEKMTHKNISALELRPFFRNGEMNVRRFTNSQLFNQEELIGRACSSSYVPAPGQPNHDKLKEGLIELFARTNVNGRVSFDYETEVFWGEV